MCLLVLGVRTLVIRVAIVAVILGMVAIPLRRARFQDLASYHYRWSAGPYSVSLVTPEGLAELRKWGEEAKLLSPERREWHRIMAEKYWRAAELPWLPVAPDPPMPP